MNWFGDSDGFMLRRWGSEYQCDRFHYKMHESICSKSGCVFQKVYTLKPIHSVKKCVGWFLSEAVELQKCSIESYAWPVLSCSTMSCHQNDNSTNMNKQVRSWYRWDVCWAVEWDSSEKQYPKAEVLVMIILLLTWSHEIKQEIETI